MIVQQYYHPHKLDNRKARPAFTRFKHYQRHNGPEELSSAYHSNMFRSYHKFKHNSWSNFIFRISIKHQLQNLNETSASRLNLKFKILTEPSFSVSTKIQLHNLCKTSAAKYWPNSSLKILPELQLQYLDQTLCLKSEQKFGFITKPQLRSMQQTVANTILIINISNSNNLNKFWVAIFTRQDHINQVY